MFYFTAKEAKGVVKALRLSWTKENKTFFLCSNYTLIF